MKATAFLGGAAKTLIMIGVTFLVVTLVIRATSAVITAAAPKTPELGSVLIFPDGWTPVTQGMYGTFTCERDGVYRMCVPVSVEATDQP